MNKYIHIKQNEMKLKLLDHGKLPSNSSKRKKLKDQSINLIPKKSTSFKLLTLSVRTKYQNFIPVPHTKYTMKWLRGLKIFVFEDNSEYQSFYEVITSRSESLLVYSFLKRSSLHLFALSPITSAGAGSFLKMVEAT